MNTARLNLLRTAVAVLLILASPLARQGYASIPRITWWNESLPVEQRVADLLEQMSLEDKLAQLDMLNGRELATTGVIDRDRVGQLLGPFGVGSVHDFYPATPEQANALQQAIINTSHWKIPALFVEETLHGYVQAGSTCFPIPLALAATWDEELVEAVGHAIAAEARAMGTHVGLSPVLGIAREPRWGRVEETFGEDTYLVSVMGRAMVDGFQGGDLSQPDAIAAVVKHFAVHSMPVSGANSSPSSVGKREALQFFLPPFQAALADDGARGVMTAYSEWNGVPCTGDRWLLRDLLREQWGFTGFTLADMGAIRMLSTCHFTTKSPRESLQRAVGAGVDMQFYDFPRDPFISELKRLVQDGGLSMAEIDAAVANVLRLKFELGLFNNPFVDETRADSVRHSAGHRALALDAARQSVVLLKNEGVLPLGEDITKLAVIGPAATSTYTGGYSPKQAEAQSLLEGLREVMDDRVEIRHQAGVSFLNEGVPVPGEVLRTVDQAGKGLNASYFANAGLAGEPVLTRVDPALDFYWDTHSPAAAVPPDSFSVRWEGWLVPDQDLNGWIGVSSDDGCRLWLDDRLVIDSWETGVTIRRTPVRLKAGQRVKLRLDYRELLWGASAGLRWSVDAEDIASAEAAARWADVAVVAVGENDLLIGENRDRLALELSGNQDELVRWIAGTGTPTVVVLLSGRPVALGNLEGRENAILAGWFGGEAAGRALAEVLVGQVNPSGHLPITFPRHTGQIPCYYNRKPSKIMRYSDGDAFPAFPFGHGLSYTEFAYSDLTLDRETVTAADTVRVQVTVTNQGERAGATVVQVYVNDLYSTVTTPLKELKAFRRVELAARESQVVTLELPVSRLALVDEELNTVVEPGVFELMIGESSEDIRLRGEVMVQSGPSAP